MNSIDTERNKMLSVRNNLNIYNSIVLGLHHKECLVKDARELDPDCTFSDEVYGPMACIYVHIENVDKQTMHNFLEDKGHFIKEYTPLKTLEVQVEWFPGIHWKQ
jgi:hypothetical protein